MKIEDANKFKGKVKGAIQQWIESKIDEMIPGKATAKVFLKNGVNNMLARQDEKLNQWLDTAFLFVADEKGVIDSNVMVDTLVGIFEETVEKEYHFGMIDAFVGNGTVEIGVPQNLLSDMLLGGMKSVKFTKEDILDFKKFLV